MNIKLDIDGQEEKIDMWTVAEQLKEMGRNEGKAEGIAEGKAEERAEIIINMYRNGMKISEISKVTSIPMPSLEQIVATKKG